jgi:hypothetical protein
MTAVRLTAHYYQQFDADFGLDVPGEGYGGWKTAEVPLSLEHTAVVLMHAYSCGTRDEYPGWHRAVEYIPRAYEISRTVLPPLLAAVRASPLPLFHVVGGGDYFRSYPGYQRACALAGPEPPRREQAPRDPVREQLDRFRAERVFTGLHNQPDIARGAKCMDFLPEARPVGEEGVAATSNQLFALCRAAQVNHLIYAGFAINWCLLLSPGGMAEMQKHGIMCSALRQAVTAVENRETARDERGKEIALWRVALAFGFVFDVDTVVGALKRQQ